MSELPSGVVTFLFTDIEGSTRLVKTLRERYPQILAEHRRLVRAAIASHSGHEVDTQGDAFFAAFAGAKQAVLCALEIQRALAGHEWPAGAPVRVRIGIHTGNAVPAGDVYTGLAVHRTARICAAAHGGQVLVSQATQTIIEDEEEAPGFTLLDVGERTLKDLDRPVRLFQLAAPGLDPPDPAAGVPLTGALPVPATPLVGREREAAAVADLFQRGEHECAVPPLPVPPAGTGRDAGEVQGYASVGLFVCSQAPSACQPPRRSAGRLPTERPPTERPPTGRPALVRRTGAALGRSWTRWAPWWTTAWSGPRPAAASRGSSC